MDEMFGADDLFRTRVALKIFIDGFRYSMLYVFIVCSTLFLTLAFVSPLRTAQYSIKGIYVQLAGVADGKIVPLAFVPPSDVDINEFISIVLVPEFSRLVRGITVTHRGTPRVPPRLLLTFLSGRSVLVVGDIVMVVGDHPGLAPFMNVPGSTVTGLFLQTLTFEFSQASNRCIIAVVVSRQQLHATKSTSIQLLARIVT